MYIEFIGQLLSCPALMASIIACFHSYYGDEDNTNGGVPDSLKLITNQLGIPGSGVELVNNLKPTTMREHVVKHYMRQREEEFTYKKHYT